MKNFKKALSLILALASISSFVPSAFAADGNEDVYEVTGETVLYYNDFNDAITGEKYVLKDVENDQFHLKVNPTTGHCGTQGYIAGVELDGEQGIAVPLAVNTNVGYTFFFDFVKGSWDIPVAQMTSRQEGIKSGKYVLSFDFSISGTEKCTKSYGQNCVAINMKRPNGGNGNRNNHDGTRMFYVERMGLSMVGLGGWPSESAIVGAQDPDKIYTIDAIIDADAKKIYYYLDGNLFNTHTGVAEEITDLAVSLCNETDFIDNLKFVQLDDEHNVELDDINVSEDGVAYSLNDYVMSVNGVTAEYTDIYSGEKIPATVKSAGNSKTVVAIPSKDLVPGREYVLDVNDAEVATLRGSVTLADEAFNFGEENCIKKLTLNDFNGGKDSFAKETVAELESFTFEFTEDVVAQSALENLTLEDADGNEVEFDVVTKDTNVADVVFSSSLKGDTTYNMTLPGMSTEYSWSFTTKEGKVALKPIKVFAEDGETELNLSDVSVGDKVKVKVSLVSTKTLTEDYSAMVTLGLYSENSLDGFEFEEVTLTAENDSFEKTVEFEITDATDLKVKGFLWKGLGTRTPITAAVEAK